MKRIGLMACVVAVLLSSCGGGGSEEGAGGEEGKDAQPITYVLVDRSKSSDSKEIQEEQFASAQVVIKGVAAEGGKVTLSSITASGYDPGKVTTLTLKGEGTNDLDKEQDAQAKSSQAVAAVRDILKTESSAGTDVFFAVRSACSELAGKAGPKRIVILSDMFSNVGDYNFSGITDKPSADRLLQKIKDAGDLPNCKGVTFYAYGVGLDPNAEVDPGAVDQIVSLWRDDLLPATGAEVAEFSRSAPSSWTGS